MAGEKNLENKAERDSMWCYYEFPYSNSTSYQTLKLSLSQGCLVHKALKADRMKEFCMISLFLLSSAACTLPFYSYFLWDGGPFLLTSYSCSGAPLFMLCFGGSDFLLLTIIVNKQQSPPIPFLTQLT